MTPQDHDLMRADDDGMIAEHKDSRHKDSRHAAYYSRMLRDAEEEDAARAAQEFPPGTRVRSTRRNDRGKVEGWDDALGMAVIGWESGVGLEACAPHEYDLAENEGLGFHRMKHILGDAIAEWTVGDYLQDGSLSPAGEILLRLPDHRQLGVQVQGFSDGEGTLQRFLASGIFSRFRKPGVSPAEVESLLVEHGIKSMPETQRARAIHAMSEEIRELQAQDRQDELRHDAQADAAIESEEQ